VTDAARLVTERDFRQQVMELARLCGWLCYFTWTAVHSPPGFPDLVLCRPPRLIIVELKSDKGRVTAAQEEWLEALARVPWLECYVWRPDDWPEIEAQLQRRAARE